MDDLLHRPRVKLIFRTNICLRQGWSHRVHGQDSTILDLYPAEELYRASKHAYPRDWAARWLTAGGHFHDGRMIALKHDPVWLKLSAFGYAFAPFDVNSGMRTRDISRSDAMRLCLIDRDTGIPPQNLPPKPEMFFFDALPSAPAATPYLTEGELEERAWWLSAERARGEELLDLVDDRLGARSELDQEEAALYVPLILRAWQEDTTLSQPGSDHWLAPWREAFDESALIAAMQSEGC